MAARDATSAPLQVVTPRRSLADADPYETLVPEGEYDLAYIAEEKFFIFRRKVWAVVFQIVDGQYSGLPIHAFYNIPPLRDRRTPSAALSSAYEAATGLRSPRKIARCRPSGFLEGCVVAGAVRTVERDIHGRERPPNARHSVVDHLIRRVSGAPPPLRRRRP